MGLSDVLSILALAVSFVALFVKFFFSRKSLRVSLYQKVTELFFSLHQPFLEHPEMRAYFYEGKSHTGAEDAELARLRVTGEMFLDTFEWIMHDIDNSDHEDVESWEDYILHIYANSSITREMHIMHPEWHPLFQKLLVRKNHARI